MILDELLEFADATALSTAGTGRTLVGDVIDLGSGTVQDFGNGKPMWLVIQVTTAVAGTSSTVSFELVSDAAAAIATDASATEHIVTEAIPEATLVAGYQLVIPLPTGSGRNYERFLGLIQNTGTAALSAGAINAFLTFDPNYWVAPADGTN